MRSKGKQGRRSSNVDHEHARGYCPDLFHAAAPLLTAVCTSRSPSSVPPSPSFLFNRRGGRLAYYTVLLPARFFLRDGGRKKCAETAEGRRRIVVHWRHAAEEAGASWTNCARAGGVEYEERRRAIAVPRRPRCRSRRHRCFDLFSTDVLSLARVPARVLMCFSACEQPVTTVQHGLSYSEGLVSNAGLAAFVAVLFFPSFVVRPHTRARRTWHATHSKAWGHSPAKNNPVRFFSLLLAPSCSQSPAPRQA